MRSQRESLLHQQSIARRCRQLKRKKPNLETRLCAKNVAKLDLLLAQFLAPDFIVKSRPKSAHSLLTNVKKISCCISSFDLNEVSVNGPKLTTPPPRLSDLRNAG